MNNTISFCMNDKNKIQDRRDQTIQPNSYPKNLYNQNSKDCFGYKLKANKISFGGGFSAMDCIIKPMNMIELGGKMAEFIVLDVISMVLPRTILGFYRNREELGHWNYQAGKEEAIREILTGPSMFLIPMAFLFAGRLMGGKSTNIRFDELNCFKKSFNELPNTVAKSSTAAPNAFYNQVFKDVIHATFGHEEKDLGYVNKKGLITYKSIDDHSDKLAKNVAAIIKEKRNINTAHKKLTTLDKSQYALKIHRNSSKFKEIEDSKDKIKKLTAKINNRIIKLNKFTKNKGDYNDPASLRLDATKPGTIKIQNLTSNMIDYAEDRIAKFTNPKNTKPFEKIHNMSKFGRIAMIFSAVISTSIFLYNTPRIYQLSKTYPGVSGLGNNNNSNKPSNSINKGGQA